MLPNSESAGLLGGLCMKPKQLALVQISPIPSDTIWITSLQLDIKSPNILLAKDYTAKIADLGLAKFMARQGFTQMTAQFTPQWAAPELLRWDLLAKALQDMPFVTFGVS